MKFRVPHFIDMFAKGMQSENTQNVYNLRTSPNEYKSRIMIKTMKNNKIVLGTEANDSSL
jgi:hypothetical protein